MTQHCSVTRKNFVADASRGFFFYWSLLTSWKTILLREIVETVIPTLHKAIWLFIKILSFNLVQILRI